MGQQQLTGLGRKKIRGNCFYVWTDDFHFFEEGRVVDGRQTAAGQKEGLEPMKKVKREMGGEDEKVFP
jgi:hypothetical protein